MKQRSLFAFCIILGIAGFAAAQGKNVTNSDLEKYRQNRLKGEREYRENYVRLGLPSPEELDRRREQSRIETEQLSAKLRGERLERERIEAQLEANARLAAAYRTYYQSYEPQYYEPSYFWSHGRRYRFPVRQPYVQPGYFAGGQFWPTGPSTRPRPMLIQRR